MHRFLEMNLRRAGVLDGHELYPGQRSGWLLDASVRHRAEQNPALL